MITSILLTILGLASSAMPGESAAAGGTASSAPSGEAAAAQSHGLLFIQGRLKAGEEATYQQYLEGTGPLMSEYGAEVVAIGGGVQSQHTDQAWPINALLRFPDLQSAEAFLADRRYQRIKALRDQAYEELHLTLVQGRPARVRGPKQVAEEAFVHFRHGLATGQWQAFLDRLHEDFTFRFPLGRFQGLNRGKAKAAEFFAFVSQAYPEGLEITEVERVTAEGERVVFEFADRGLLRGEPYDNVVAVSLDVCGEQICAYREYFGKVGPPPGAGS